MDMNLFHASAALQVCSQLGMRVKIENKNVQPPQF